ncbi:hypothetical protein [Geomonas oryzae]|uniref:hypothetical protein n=1 Tax=Geomonas oryzae TaxID=2364273 RepID=UPI00100A7D93|nr:hypothetical protein [Geomonas oryzae]
MVIEKHVGKTVLLNIREEFASSNGSLIQSAVNTKLFYAKVVDFDSYGLWVENPNWTVFPKDGGPSRNYKINFVIPWPQIISVATFPERVFKSGEISDEKGISFIGFES